MKKLIIVLLFILLCYCIYLVVASLKAKDGVDGINQQRENAVQINNNAH